jgi:hypothetical protein
MNFRLTSRPLVIGFQLPKNQAFGGGRFWMTVKAGLFTAGAGGWPGAFIRK